MGLKGLFLDHHGDANGFFIHRCCQMVALVTINGFDQVVAKLGFDGPLYGQ